MFAARPIQGTHQTLNRQSLGWATLLSIARWWNPCSFLAKICLVCLGHTWAFNKASSGALPAIPQLSLSRQSSSISSIFHAGQILHRFVCGVALGAFLAWKHGVTVLRVGIDGVCSPPLRRYGLKGRRHARCGVIDANNAVRPSPCCSLPLRCLPCWPLLPWRPGPRETRWKTPLGARACSRRQAVPVRPFFATPRAFPTLSLAASSRALSARPPKRMLRTLSRPTQTAMPCLLPW